MTFVFDEQTFSPGEQKLPLKALNYDLELPAAKMLDGSFPPARFDARNKRFDLYAALGQGDFGAFAATDLSHPLNYLGRVVTTMVDWLMQNPPEAPIDLDVPAASAIESMYQYGGALVWGGIGPDGPFVRVINPRMHYRVDDGSRLLVRPYVSSDPPGGVAQPDLVELTLIRADGVIEVAVHEWRDRIVGRAVAPAQVVGSGQVFTAQRSPINGTWGTSGYDSLISPALAMSQLYGRATQELLTAWRTWELNEDDARTKFDELIRSIYGNTPTESDQEAGVALGLRRLLGDKTDGVIPKEAVKVSTTDYRGNVNAVAEMLKQARMFMNFMSSVPGLNDREQFPTSGVALRLEYGSFYAATRRLIRTAELALSGAVEAATGRADAVSWEHYFDTIDSDTTQPMEVPNG